LAAAVAAPKEGVGQSGDNRCRRPDMPGRSRRRGVTRLLNGRMAPSIGMESVRPSIDAKLRRAFEHMDELEAAVRAFSRTRPVIVELDPPGDGGFQIARLRVVREPPLELGVVAGEIVHQLRSSLDHLMTELVLRHTGSRGDTPLVPIYSTEKGFTDFVKGARLKRLIDPRHVEMLREVQPYQDLSRPGLSVIISYLEGINLFDNADKHEVVHPGIVGYGGGVQWTRPRQDDPRIDAFDWRVGHTTVPPMETGIAFFKVRFKPGQPPLRFELDPPPTVEFFYGRRHWRLDSFRNFGKRVADLVSTFLD
jgi:hypothetical protein